MSHRHGHGARLWPLFRAWLEATAPDVHAAVEKEAAGRPSFAEAIVVVLRRGIAAPEREETAPASSRLSTKESA